MAGAIRRSVRNLQKLAVSQNSGEQNYDIYKRDYSLNMSKAMKKKVRACDAEYKVKTTNRGGNQIIEFSAAMYELYRSSLIEHFEALQSRDSANLKIECKDITEKSSLCVESVIRVFDRDDLNPKYTINLYHTKSKVMVNGREVTSFSAEHSKIAESILTSENVNMLDQELRINIIDGLKSIESNCIKSRSTKLKDGTKQTRNNQNLVINSADAGKSEPVQDQSPRVISQIDNSQNMQSNEEQNEICPMCEIGVEYGICCDLCLKWYHFQCESLDDNAIENFQDADVQYFCISCTYDNQCETLNDSILYTQNGVTEAGEETYPKTLDRSTDHPSPQTYLKSPYVSNEDGSNDLHPLNITEGPASSMNTELTCIPNEKCATKGSRHKPRGKSQGTQKSSSLMMAEASRDAGSYSNEAIDKVFADNITDKVIDGHHNRTKSLNVQSKALPNPNLNHKESQKQQVNVSRAENNQNCDGTGLDSSQDNSSRGLTDSGGGTYNKNGKQTSKQNKRTEKSKLKEGEQEEQLKLARSLISNLERKVGELENTIGILRQSQFMGSCANNQSNVHVQAEQAGNIPTQGSIPNMGVPAPNVERDLLSLKENLKRYEVEHMTKMNYIEQTLQLQNNLNVMLTLGNVGQRYINPYNANGIGPWPGGSQGMYGNYPYLAHAFPYQGFLSAPQNPVFPNMYPPNTVPTPFHGLNMQNYCTPQMAPMMNNPMMGGYPIFYRAQHPFPSTVGLDQGRYGSSNGAGGSSGGREPNQTRGEQHRNHRGDTRQKQPETASMDASRHSIQAQNMAIDVDDNATRNKDMSKHAQKVITKSTTSQVMECNEDLGSIDHSLSSNRTQDLPEHNPIEAVSLGEGTSPIGLPQESNKKEAECKERKQEKPFLGAGRASEKTAKRRSL